MESNRSQRTCPLCRCGDTAAYHTDRNREYLQCSFCKLVFVPRKFHLNEIDEKAVYNLHENSPDDEGYRTFLSRLAKPLSERLTTGRKGLDFGCGPGPALSLMLEEKGHLMSVFDPYFFNTPSLLDETYDFITATEVVEHLSSPGGEFERLFSMLGRDGILGIMTKLVRNHDAFCGWHYIHDQTHICFYSRETFKYIAEHYKAELEFIGDDVIIMIKQ